MIEKLTVSLKNFIDKISIEEFLKNGCIVSSKQVVGCLTELGKNDECESMLSFLIVPSLVATNATWIDPLCRVETTSTAIWVNLKCKRNIYVKAKDEGYVKKWKENVVLRTYQNQVWEEGEW